MELHAMAKPSLRFEITAALVFKALALLLLYLAFFSGSHRSAVTPERMAAALTGRGPGAK
jgi:hypothetical protein